MAKNFEKEIKITKYKMKSLVTGGAGFIGSHLCEKLQSMGHKVISIDNYSVGKKRNISKLKGKINRRLIPLRLGSHIPLDNA